jgi:sortase (surface protein transpeptidase)
MARILLVLTGIAFILGGAYFLYSRETYDHEAASKQAEVLSKLSQVIPDYQKIAQTEQKEQNDSAQGQDEEPAQDQGERQAKYQGQGQDQGSDQNEGSSEENAAADNQQTYDVLLTDETDFPVISIDGVDCVGILQIPSLDLEVAVAAPYVSLDYMAHIKQADSDNGSFSIVSENRDFLLGRLPDVSEGDEVIFTDARGSRYAFKVDAVYTGQDISKSAESEGNISESTESEENISESTESGQSYTPVLNLCCPQGNRWFVAECTEVIIP